MNNQYGKGSHGDQHKSGQSGKSETQQGHGHQHQNQGQGRHAQGGQNNTQQFQQGRQDKSFDKGQHNKQEDRQMGGKNINNEEEE